MRRIPAYVALLFSLAADAQTHPPPSRIRVAVVQMHVLPSLAENRDRIVTGIEQAAERGARVAVFPEGALGGRGGDRLEAVDEAVDGIRRAARARGVHVVLGAHTWLRSVAKNANWMLAIDSEGRDRFRYEKIYDNHRAAMPGVFEVEGVPCGAMICADRWLRGVAEIPIQQGAQICFELSNNFACEWVEPYGWYWNVAFALRNNVWSVFANSANRVAGQAPSSAELKHGHSAIVAPDGRIAAAARGDAEDLVVADIEPAAATRAGALARSSHPTLRPFWDAGLRLQQGGDIGPTSPGPLRSPSTNVSVAAAAVSGDPAAIEAWIREARQREADLVAFPAQAIGEESLGRIQAAARASRITVVLGALHQEPDGPRNSAFVIGADGVVLTRYDQLSARRPCLPGTDAAAMWFRVKGVPAVVTVGEDALWTELSELAAVAGAQIHVHLDSEAEARPADRLRRLQTWASLASFLTLSVTVGQGEAMIWDDLRGRDESRAVVKGLSRPDTGGTEVYSPFSANLVARAGAGSLAVALRHVSTVNPHHPARTSALNPQMRTWYELGAQIIGPR
jgi:predicted amidohydrolase